MESRRTRAAGALGGAAPRVNDPHTLSGTVSASTRAPSENLEAQGTASTNHTRLTVNGPLGPRGAGGGFLISGRGGYPTIIASTNDQSYQRGVTRDWLGKIEMPVRQTSLRLLGYLNENDLYTGAVAEGAGVTQPANEARNVFEWTSASIGASWERESATTPWRALAWSARSGASSAWRADSGALEIASTRRDEGASLTGRSEVDAVRRCGARASNGCSPGIVSTLSTPGQGR